MEATNTSLLSKSMSKNEFAKISELVNTVISRYRQVRKDCGIPDNGWHSRSIERLATPFIKGHFTLAILGKVSSGKSTFINALLGCKDLLPTGHDQTTCGVTYIEYGENPEATIVFGDGHKIVIKDDISGKIKPYVAIPEKYHHLPVNNIDDMIMGGFDFNKIWDVRDQLEEETLCPPIDKALLKDYVSHRKKKDIAIEVLMKYPFNEELKGWRVIDTPGIGAIGGIEIRTRKLLATQKEDGSREVDAIIFLQNGSQTLDQTDTKRFVKEQLDNFTKSDKERLFYVLTHSSDSNFLNHKESKIDFINQNYGEKIKVLTYVDSLLYTFLNDFKNSGYGLDQYRTFRKNKPAGWSDDEWDAIMAILSNAEFQLEKDEESFNHETMLRILSKWSHFDELKDEINTFAKNEKQKTLDDLLKLIATDYLGFIKQLKEDQKLIGNLNAINDAIDKVKKKRDNYNNLVKKADELIKAERISEEFNFIEERLREFSYLQSIASVRTEITNLFNEVQEKERSFFADIKKQFSVFFKDSDSADIILESLDLDAIEIKATSKSREPYEISPQETIHHSSKPDEIIPAKYGTRTNPETKLREFKALAIKSVREKKDKFLPQIKEKLEEMSKQILEELNKKIKEEKIHLKGLESQLNEKKEIRKKNEAAIKKSSAASEELIKIVKDYGFQF